jgi:hypothetical protein
MRLTLLSIGDGESRTWIPTTIRALGKDEDFLEAQIGKAPALLGLEDLRTQVRGPYAAFHQLGVETPLYQNVAPDIVFLTASGHVVIVEVKLADNPDLRGRKVVAQIVEYAASIARYSEEELVELFDSDLTVGAPFSEVVRKHLPECDDPIDLANELVRKIQAAEIHLVVACDQAPEGLREFMKAVTAQQALGNYELRVCEVVPYIQAGGTGGGAILVPSGILRTEVVARTVVEVKAVDGQKPTVTAQVTPQDVVQANLAAAIERGVTATRPEILAATAAYMRVAEPGTSEVGRASNYRIIRVSGWPGSLHYEFIHRSSDRTLGAELHFESESEAVTAASEAVRDSHLQPSVELPGLVWDQKWSSGKGRLKAVFPDATAPDVLAKAMVALIRRTRAIVDGALTK